MPPHGCLPLPSRASLARSRPPPNSPAASRAHRRCSSLPPEIKSSKQAKPSAVVRVGIGAAQVAASYRVGAPPDAVCLVYVVVG